MSRPHCVSHTLVDPPIQARIDLNGLVPDRVLPPTIPVPPARRTARRLFAELQRYGPWAFVLTFSAVTFLLLQLNSHEPSAGDTSLFPVMAQSRDTSAQAAPVAQKAEPAAQSLSPEQAKPATDPDPAGNGQQQANEAKPAESPPTDHAGVSKETEPVDNQAPATPPRQTETVVHSEAIPGKPFGVGRIEIIFGDDTCPVWYPDDAFVVKEQKNRIRFPATELFFQKNESDNNAARPAKMSRSLRRVVVRFLFLGDQPLVAQLGSSRAIWLESCDLNPQKGISEHRFMLDTWWQEYCQDAGKLRGNARFVRQLMQRALACRLGYSAPPFPRQELEERSMADLERMFERSLSTLLGIDSLLLAVPEVDRSNDDSKSMTATLPLPTAIRARGIDVPTVSTLVSVEPLANHVPQNCFYLRCGSLANLAWLRGFITSWGGSLHEIVSVPSLDRSIRPRIERQLVLGLNRSRQTGFDDCISDMAVIGCDFFFQEGAAVGVLFEAKDPARLRQLIQRQRIEAREENPLINQKAVKVATYPVSLLTTKDHTVRSFYASTGRYHLITNCAQIARDFLSLRDGRGSLGKLNEFRYARKQVPVADQRRVFIYLSDPFFRQLATPHYRVELIRRARSLAESHELAVASLVGSSADEQLATVEQLTANGYLPDSFGQRPDGSQLNLVDGHAVDSLRGQRGTYLPIPDVAVGRVTSEEQAAYRQFTSRYQQQWGRVDPLTVTIGSREGLDVEHVQIGVHITPYARQRYSFLTRHLAAKSQDHAQPIQGDVLHVDARLKDQRGKPYDIHMGLQDRDVTYEINNGTIRRTDVSDAAQFSQTNQYVAVHPGGTEGLLLVQQFIANMQNPKGQTESTPRAQRGFDPLVFLFAALFPERIFKILLGVSTLEWTAQNDQWTVFARDAAIREHVLANAGMTTSSESAQVRLSVLDPNRARVTDYLNAFAYVESRKISAQNAQLLNDLRSQLGMAPDSALSAARFVFEADPVCPLGGKYSPQEADAGSTWTSSAWTEPSLYQLKTVPKDYRFPFLAWLRGADVKFTLSSSTNTLAAEIDLVVQPIIVDNPYEVRHSGSARAEASENRQRRKPLVAGDLVRVAKGQAKLRIGARTVARVAPDTQLMVVDVRDEWIGVWGFQKEKAVRGWLRRDELLRE